MELSGRPVTDRQPVDLTDVLMTHRLDDRPVRAGERGYEAEALVAVLDLLATRPADALREIVRQACKITGSGSAGLSLVEHKDQEPVIRWQASTGVVGEDIDAIMPRYNSPCGAALDYGQPMLLNRPDRVFPAIAAAPYPIEEALMVPFEVDGQLIGSLWVVSHDLRKQYDANDRQKLIALTALAPLALAARRDGRASAVTAGQARDLIRGMPLIVWTATPALAIDAFSDPWFAYTGHSPIVDIARWHEAVAERDLPLAQTAFARAAKEGQPFEVPARLRRAEDDAERWHLLRAHPSRDADGQIAFWLGTATDFHDAGDQLGD